MFHSRSGHTTMSDGAQHSTQAAGADIELQEVGPFAAHGDSPPPPQTRPFTGVLDHHHCLLLSQPHSGGHHHHHHHQFHHHHHPHHQPGIPLPSTGYRIPRHYVAGGCPVTHSHKRRSSAVPNQDKANVRVTQNPLLRRHSSSSQKLRPRRSPSPPVSSRTREMTEPRRDQINGITAISSAAENHVQRSNDPGIENRSAEAATAGSGAGCVSSDTTTTEGALLRRAGNNYDRLQQSGQSASSQQHVYRPISDNPYAANPTKASNSGSSNSATTTTTTPNPNPNPSKYSKKPSLPGARSPLYDSVDVCTQQVGPVEESHPFLSSPSKLRSQNPEEHPDDIIELQSDIRTTPPTTAAAGGGSREEKQNKCNTRKEVPQVTEIPNTNFAIACMVALCFNLPFGVLAMYFSLRAVKAFQDGRAKLGEKRSRWSIVMSLLGITLTTVIISSVVLYTAIQGQKRISRHKVYGTRAGLNL